MKVKKVILFLSVAMLLAGCNKDNAPVAVSEVTLSRTALTMTVGDTEKTYSYRTAGACRI